MKKLKWTTTQEWVDKYTGEVLTKDIALKEYRIERKQIHKQIIKYYEPLRYGGAIQQERGLITVTNICTREGKQCRLFS